MNQNRTQLESFSGPSRVLEGRRYDANWLDTLVNKRNNTVSYNHHLKDVIDIDKDLTLFSNKQLNILNPKRLYGQELVNFSSSIYLMEEKKN